MDESPGKRLTADFKALMSDVEDLLKATAGQAGERMGELRRRLEKEIADGREALAESSWFQKARKAKSETEILFAQKYLDWAPASHRHRRSLWLADRRR